MGRGMLNGWIKVRVGLKRMDLARSSTRIEGTLSIEEGGLPEEHHGLSYLLVHLSKLYPKPAGFAKFAFHAWDSRRSMLYSGTPQYTEDTAAVNPKLPRFSYRRQAAVGSLEGERWRSSLSRTPMPFLAIRVPDQVFHRMPPMRSAAGDYL